MKARSKRFDLSSCGRIIPASAVSEVEEFLDSIGRDNIIAVVSFTNGEVLVFYWDISRERMLQATIP